MTGLHYDGPNSGSPPGRSCRPSAGLEGVAPAGSERQRTDVAQGQQLPDAKQRQKATLEDAEILHTTSKTTSATSWHTL
jgi:hypothetical protein